MAAQENRIVVVAYWSAFNDDCIKMDRDVFSREEVKTCLGGTIPVRINASTNQSFGEAYGLNVIPSFVTFAPDGRVLKKRSGYLDEGRFRGFIEASILSQ
jgi:hypothetical protein